MRIFYRLALVGAVIGILCSTTYGQKIKLTNPKNNKQIILSKGLRVVYRLKDKKNNFSVKGILNEVTATGMVVGEKSISFENLAALGKKKKGSGFGSVVLGSLGAAMIGSAIAMASDKNDPCPTCQTVSVEDEGGTAGNILAVAGGVTLFALSINVGVKNSPRDLSIWKLEVIE